MFGRLNHRIFAHFLRGSCCSHWSSVLIRFGFENYPLSPSPSPSPSLPIISNWDLRVYYRISIYNTLICCKWMHIWTWNIHILLTSFQLFIRWSNWCLQCTRVVLFDTHWSTVTVDYYLSDHCIIEMFDFYWKNTLWTAVSIRRVQRWSECRIQSNGKIRLKAENVFFNLHEYSHIGSDRFFIFVIRMHL